MVKKEIHLDILRNCIFTPPNKYKKEENSKNYKQWPQYLSAITANLCLISLGMNFGWSSPSLPLLLSENSTISITNSEASWIISIQSLGDFIGAPLAAILCDLIGRKETILLTTLPHFIAWLIIGFGKNATHLIIARIISGISEGAIFICVPMYIGEIAEPQIRGILGTLITLALITGIFLINLIGGLINDIQITALACATVPVITVLTFGWMPESPYYNIMKNQTEKAKTNLRRLRNSNQIEDEILNIEKCVYEQMKNPTTLKTIFLEKPNRRALCILIIMRIFQQFCGISALTYFLLPIFNESEVSLTPLTATIMYMTAQIIATTLCLLLVDKLGRKPLMISSLIGTSVCLFIMGGYFFSKDFLNYDVSQFRLIPLIGMLGYIVVFSLGYGTLPTLLLSELFAANIKAKALCLTHFVFAFFLFFSAKTFLYFHDNFGIFVPFWFYSFSAIAAVFYTLYFVPETKGKSLEEIQNWLQK